MAQGGQDQRPGRLDTADDLDHQVDVLAGDQSGRVSGEQGGVDARPLPAGAADRDADQLQRPADPGPQVVGLPDDQPGDFGADGAAAEQGDAERASGPGGWARVGSGSTSAGPGAYASPVGGTLVTVT